MHQTDGVRCWWFFVVTMLFYSLSAYATSVYDRIVQNMVPNSITIIGESHQRLQSVQFFKSLVDSYLQQNQCITVALEIASSQQSMIDKIVRGKAVVAAIKIAPMIDHPPFRAMIEGLVRMRSNGACLELIAIDAGIEANTDRDERMAAKLAEQVGQTPVLALLGNLHTLKKVDWHWTIIHASLMWRKYWYRKIIAFTAMHKFGRIVIAIAAVDSLPQTNQKPPN